MLSLISERTHGLCDGIRRRELLTIGGRGFGGLEARNRVGGRMHGVRVAPGVVADGGAAYLGARHTELLAMIDEYDLSLASTMMDGDSTFLIGDTCTTTPGRVPPLNAVALGDLFDRLDDLEAAGRARTGRATLRWAGADAQVLSMGRSGTVRVSRSRAWTDASAGQCTVKHAP